MRQQDNLAQRALEVKKQTQSGRRSKDLPSEEAIPSSSLRQEEKMVDGGGGCGEKQTCIGPTEKIMGPPK
jgi:hypothetical protein